MNNDVRRTDAQKDVYSWQRQRRGVDGRTIKYTAPAAVANVAKAYANGVFSAVFTGEDPEPEVLMEGVPHMVGSRIGINFYDTRLGEQGTLLVEGEGLLKCVSGDSWADGDVAYMIPPATATTGGLITSSDGGGANHPVGQFVGASTDTVESKITVSSKAPLRLADGTYARVWVFPVVV